MQNKKKGNYAFIDGQNLYLGLKEAGLNLSYKKFRVYLKDKYGIEKAYLFIGYLPENRELYDSLQDDGYLLKFKPVLQVRGGRKQKGDVDADLAFNMMRYYKEYNKAILITSDGDFDTIVKYLKKKQKLEAVISPSRKKCSILLQKSAGETMQYIEDVGGKILKVDENDG